MSLEARREAIEIVAELLDERYPEAGTEPGDVAIVIVDKLLETHAISRRAPRVHRPASPSRRSILEEIDL